MPEAFIGRQPIYDRNLDVYGYELLFRRGHDERAEIVDPDVATSQVIVNAFHEIGLGSIVGERHAFVNLTRGFVVGEFPLPIPTRGVVLEVLEDVVPDGEVMDGLRGLARRGYRIALDDFVYGDATAPLLEVADIVKLCVDEHEPDQLEEAVRRMRGHGVVLVAEVLETVEDFEACRELGFDLFQGYFLSRPKIVQGHRVLGNRLGLMRVLARVVDPACDVDELESLIEQDVSLTYQLLRHINSALYGMPRTIESVRETVMVLGLDAIRNLVTLFLLAGMDDRPQHLLQVAMFRGKMAELLGKAAGERDLGRFFATGMLSTLGALLQAPLDVTLEQMPLAPQIVAALLECRGKLGEALACVLAYESGCWENVAFGGLSAGEIKRAFLGAVTWSEHVGNQLHGGRA